MRARSSSSCGSTSTRSPTRTECAHQDQSNVLDWTFCLFSTLGALSNSKSSFLRDDYELEHNETATICTSKLRCLVETKLATLNGCMRCTDRYGKRCSVALLRPSTRGWRPPCRVS
eukprot:1028176-Pleurochrysis_carterae.AAC.2